MDDFQKQHLYEGLIDFMQDSNKNAEEKTLSYEDMLIILQILEQGSLNEQVRSNLSDKKKIKDLFLVVINTIVISKNKKLVASLIQFISNLCYGQGKLKAMLARENISDLVSTFQKILYEIIIETKYEDTIDQDDQENINPKSKDIFEKKEAEEKSLLKNTMYAFIGNLCTEK